MWMDVDAALGAVPVNILALTDDTDFKAREESVVYNQSGLDLVWNFITTGGAYTQTAVTPTDTAGDYDWINKGNGMYSIEIPASGGASINNDTEGFGWFSGFATGILPWSGPVIGFRAAVLNNSLIDGAATFPTVAELNARTLVAANYFDPTADDVAVVTTLTGHTAQTADHTTAIAAVKTEADKIALADAGAGVAGSVIEEVENRPTTPMRGTDGVDTATMRGTDSALTDKAGFSLAATGINLLTKTEVGVIEFAKALLDHVNSKAQHNVPGSFGKQVRLAGNLTQIDGTVSGTPTKEAFDTNLTQQNTYWEDAVLVFSNGAANAGKGHPVLTSVNANGRVTFDSVDAWAVTPVSGDDFVMYAMHAHPVSQIVEEIWKELLTAITTSGSIGKLIKDEMTPARMSELDAGTPGKAANQIDEIRIDTAEIGTAGAGLTDLGAMSTGMKAEVNVEVKDVLVTDTLAEVSAVPAANAPLADKINWMFALARNKALQTSTTKTLRNDADSADISTSTVSDDGTTFTRGEWS